MCRGAGHHGIIGDGPGGLTTEGASIMAGVLTALPSLLAVLAPSVGSYARLQPGHWSGAYACWGIENREAALRFIPGTIASRSRSATARGGCESSTRSTTVRRFA